MKWLSVLMFLACSMLLAACGGSGPRSEPTWETHTVSPEDEPDDAVMPEQDY